MPPTKRPSPREPLSRFVRKIYTRKNGAAAIAPNFFSRFLFFDAGGMRNRLLHYHVIAVNGIFPNFFNVIRVCGGAAEKKSKNNNNNSTK